MKKTLFVILLLLIQINIFASKQNDCCIKNKVNTELERFANNIKLQNNFKLLGLYNGPINGEFNQEFRVALKFLLQTYMAEFKF